MASLATRWHCPSGYGHGAPGNLAERGSTRVTLAENHPEVVNIYNNLSTSEKYVCLYIHKNTYYVYIYRLYRCVCVCVCVSVFTVSCGMIGMFLDECFLANNGHQ